MCIVQHIRKFNSEKVDFWGTGRPQNPLLELPLSRVHSLHLPSKTAPIVIVHIIISNASKSQVYKPTLMVLSRMRVCNFQLENIDKHLCKTLHVVRNIFLVYEPAIKLLGHKKNPVKPKNTISTLI